LETNRVAEVDVGPDLWGRDEYVLFESNIAANAWKDQKGPRNEFYIAAVTNETQKGNLPHTNHGREHYVTVLGGE
jgi:hypothetical protein